MLERAPVNFEQINAITLATKDMARAAAFYRALGFALHYGGEAEDYITSFHVGGQFLNLIRAKADAAWQRWGRVIIYVDDVDAMYHHVLGLGLTPATEPRDAEWGERYFHLADPDGHELSFARPLNAKKED